MIKGGWTIKLGPNMTFTIPDVPNHIGISNSDQLVLQLIKEFSNRSEFGYARVELSYMKYEPPI